MNPAVRTVLEGAIDYAGLFPPASLRMPEVVSNYATYRSGSDAWALGRLVVPGSRLIECVTAAERHLEGTSPWRLSVLVSEPGWLGSLFLFNDAQHGRVVADVAEGKAATPADVDALAAARPPGVTLYVELAPDGRLVENVARLARGGVAAKIRMGGVTPSAFPAPADVTRFMRTCHAAGVPFKATAGLHHPLRGNYRLTYEPDAPSQTMYGYLNVFLAAAAIRAGADDETVHQVLTATDFTRDGDAIRMAGIFGDVATLSGGREMLAAFGSCSFREPLDDLGPLVGSVA